MTALQVPIETRVLGCPDPDVDGGAPYMHETGLPQYPPDAFDWGTFPRVGTYSVPWTGCAVCARRTGSLVGAVLRRRLLYMCVSLSCATLHEMVANKRESP